MQHLNMRQQQTQRLSVLGAEVLASLIQPTACAGNVKSCRSLRLHVLAVVLRVPCESGSAQPCQHVCRAA